ncbi:hypothetical protein [Maribacter sp. 2308TA10-17]|uniref:hypothetical protein n=1 Tax=Maribacter sp. 2308TA10-17 TaxID=3386276 RepID=UPI0039BC43B7
MDGLQEDQGKLLWFPTSTHVLGQTIPELIAGILVVLYGYELPLQVVTLIFGFLELFIHILQIAPLQKVE